MGSVSSLGTALGDRLASGRRHLEALLHRRSNAEQVYLHWLAASIRAGVGQAALADLATRLADPGEPGDRSPELLSTAARAAQTAARAGALELARAFVAQVDALAADLTNPASDNIFREETRPQDVDIVVGGAHLTAGDLAGAAAAFARAEAVALADGGASELLETADAIASWGGAAPRLELAALQVAEGSDAEQAFALAAAHGQLAAALDILPERPDVDLPSLACQLIDAQPDAAVALFGAVAAKDPGSLTYRGAELVRCGAAGAELAEQLVQGLAGWERWSALAPLTRHPVPERSRAHADEALALFEELVRAQLAEGESPVSAGAFGEMAAMLARAGSSRWRELFARYLMALEATDPDDRPQEVSPEALDGLPAEALARLMPLAGWAERKLRRKLAAQLRAEGQAEAARAVEQQGAEGDQAEARAKDPGDLLYPELADEIGRDEALARIAGAFAELDKRKMTPQERLDLRRKHAVALASLGAVAEALQHAERLGHKVRSARVVDWQQSTFIEIAVVAAREQPDLAMQAALRAEELEGEFVHDLAKLRVMMAERLLGDEVRWNGAW